MLYNIYMRRIPQKEREVQITKRASELDHEFIGFLDGYKNKESKLIIRCKKHGDWNPAIENYVRNGRCNQCVIESRRLDIKDVEKRVKESLNDDQTAVGVVGKYINLNSRFKVNCNHHGEWESSILHIIHSKSGCPRCGHQVVAMKRRSPLDLVLKRIDSILSKDGKYTFVSLDGDYKNSKSRVILSCKDHGEWSVDISTILANRVGCQSCSKAGFKPHDDAYLYILRSDCGRFFKVGISNNLKRRMVELKRSTPFAFSNIHVTRGIGREIRDMEKTLHGEFTSACMKGFSGATEWFIWSDSITERVKQLSLP